MGFFGHFFDQYLHDHYSLGGIKKKHLQAVLRHSTPEKLLNFALVMLQLAMRSPVVRGFPITAGIDVTSVCNLRCPICPTGLELGTRPRVHMRREMLEGIFSDVGDYLFFVTLYNWGEPFLNRDIFHMIEHAHRKNVFISISSHLNNISDEGIEQVVRSGLSHLVVSLDGASNATYEKYRVRGNFETVFNNMKKLVAKKRELGSNTPEVEWQFLVFSHNEHEIGRVKELAEEVGVDRLVVRAGSTQLSSIVDARIRDDRLKARNTAYRDDDPEPKDDTFCSWLWHEAVFNSDGGVAPCCLAYHKRDDFDDLDAGGRGFLRRIWNGREYQDSRRLFLDPSYEQRAPTICGKCYKVQNYRKRGPHGLGRLLAAFWRMAGVKPIEVEVRPWKSPPAPRTGRRPPSALTAAASGPSASST